MLKKVLGLMVFLLWTGGVAQAQVTVTYSSGGKEFFTITVADNWRLNVGVEGGQDQAIESDTLMARLMTAMPGDGTPLWFGIWVPPDMKKITAAKEYMDSLGVDLLTEVVTTRRRFDVLNGMDVFYVNGTGRKDGEIMDFHCAFVQLPQEKVIIAIYIGPPEATVNHGDELVRMVQSLQPATPPAEGGV